MSRHRLAVVRVLRVVSGDLWAGAEAQVAALVAELVRVPQLQLHAVVLILGGLRLVVYSAWCVRASATGVAA